MTTPAVGVRPTSVLGRRLRIPEALLFSFFIFEGSIPGLPASIPGADLAAIVLVSIGAFRVPTRPLLRRRWYMPFWIALLGYLVLESWVNEVDWFRRSVRLGIMVLLSIQLATGRLDLWSGLRGLLVGLVMNAALFYLHMAPDTYSGLLTGFLGDKNVAGLYYALVPMLALPFVTARRRQAALLAFFAALIFLTGSRTSMAAFVVAVVWVLLRRRISPAFQFFPLAGLFWGVLYLQDNLAQSWIFSDRTGSDFLRSRIEEAAWQKANAAPPYGLGLGQATAYLEHKDWFFHDSFLALYVEGGWVLLFAIVGLFFVTGLPLFSSFQVRPPAAWEGATLLLMTCATKLGEVFLALPAFLLLGCLLTVGAGVRTATGISHPFAGELRP